MEIWKTPQGEILTQGRPFVIPQVVEQEQFAWELQDTGERIPVTVKDAKSGKPVVKQQKVMRKTRVSKGFKEVEMNIRHPRNWHKKSDAWKESKGLIKFVKGDAPDNYNPMFHILEDGDTVDRVITQIAVSRDVEDVRERMHQVVMSKIHAPEFDVVSQQADIKDINKAIADYRAAMNERGYALFREIVEAETVRALADIKLGEGWPVIGENPKRALN